LGATISNSPREIESARSDEKELIDFCDEKIEKLKQLL